MSIRALTVPVLIKPMFTTKKVVEHVVQNDRHYENVVKEEMFNCE